MTILTILVLLVCNSRNVRAEETTNIIGTTNGEETTIGTTNDEETTNIIGTTNGGETTVSGVMDTSKPVNFINISMRPTVTVEESEGFARLTLDITTTFMLTTVSETIRLELSYSDGTTNGVNDFGSISDLQFVTIVVSAQTSMHNFNIPIIDDAIVEASEMFEVSLLNVDVLSSHLQSDVTVTMTNGMTTTDIIIQDDDTGVVGIHYGGSNNGVIPPNSNEVVVIVTSSNPFDRDVNIDLLISGDTNIFSGSLPPSVTIPAGSTSTSFSLNLQDGIQNQQSVSIQAVAPTDGLATVGGQSTVSLVTSVAITVIGFTRPSYTVREGQAVGVSLFANAVPNVAFQAEIGIFGNVNRNEIGAVPAARFTIGQSFAFISISARLDSITETSEFVTLFIDSTRLPVNVTVDSNSATTIITILDSSNSGNAQPTAESRRTLPAAAVTPVPRQSSTLSAAAIVGIVVGIIVTITMVIIVACCCLFYSSLYPSRSNTYEVAEYQNRHLFHRINRFDENVYFI
ncbi:uncharacterized protein [Apostichopus japonicus]|uniref:uncharacterized protein n=1 Tax=Stichopus japonicus TaxID=307972 RepID=UPI003AB77273